MSWHWDHDHRQMFWGPDVPGTWQVPLPLTPPSPPEAYQPGLPPLQLPALPWPVQEYQPGLPPLPCPCGVPSPLPVPPYWLERDTLKTLWLQHAALHDRAAQQAYVIQELKLERAVQQPPAPAREPVSAAEYFRPPRWLMAAVCILLAAGLTVLILTGVLTALGVL